MAQRLEVTTPDALPDETGAEAALRPSRLDEFVGQEQVKASLQIAMDAARGRGEALDHTLFFGPPGLGKTTLAMLMAREMGVQLRTSSGPVLEKAGDLVGLLTTLGPGDILFIDEIHRMRPTLEEFLYSAMEDFRVDVRIADGPNAQTIPMTLEKFTLVGATTENPSFELNAALLSRCRVYVLEPLSEEHLLQLLDRAMKSDPELKDRRIELRELYALYPDYFIDSATERARLASARLVVMQCPVHWYSLPPLLKLWLDEVLAFGWAYGPGGAALQGKDLWLALSTGGSQQAYSPEGYNRYFFDAFLPPMEQTAALCGMRFLPPLVLHGAHRASDEALDAHAAVFAERLASYPQWPEMDELAACEVREVSASERPGNEA